MTPGRRYFVLKLIFILSINLLAAAVTDAETELKLRPVKGKVYKLGLAVDQVIKQTAEGIERKLTQKLGMEYAFKLVEGEKNGSMLMEVTYSLLSFSQDGWMGKVDYDSSRDDAKGNPLTELLAFANGESFSVKMTPRGDVLEVNGADELIERVLEKAGVSDEAERKVKERILRGHFGGDVIKEIMGKKIFWFYPGEGVSEGKSWKKKTVISDRYPMIIESNCMLKEIKDGKIIIDIDSLLEPNTEANVSDSGKLIYSLSGSQKGSLTLNGKSGFILSGEIVQEFGGTVQIATGNGEKSPVSFPVIVKKKIVFEKR